MSQRRNYLQFGLEIYAEIEKEKKRQEMELEKKKKDMQDMEGELEQVEDIEKMDDQLAKPKERREMDWMGIFGPLLELDEIVDLLALYSLVNPDLRSYHTIRKHQGEGEDTISHQIKLHIIEMRNLNICYALFRVKQDVLLLPGQIIEFRSELPSFPEGACTFSIGFLRDNYLNCKGCIEGKKGKKVFVKETERMAEGYNRWPCRNIAGSRRWIEGVFVLLV